MHVPEWRNWQTHQTQNLTQLTLRAGSSPAFGKFKRDTSRCLFLWTDENHKTKFCYKFERLRAEAEVAKLMKFRHIMPFIASNQDSPAFGKFKRDTSRCLFLWTDEKKFILYHLMLQSNPYLLQELQHQHQLENLVSH